MKVRFSTIWQVFFSVFFLYATYEIFKGFLSDNSLAFKDVIVLLTAPILTFGFVFIVSTTKVILSDKGLLIHIGIGFGPFEIYELKNKRLNWHQVSNIFSVLPTWIPIRLILVHCRDQNKTHSFPLGTFISRSDEALVYLSEHVNSDVIDESVLKLITKYRKKVKNDVETDPSSLQHYKRD